MVQKRKRREARSLPAVQKKPLKPKLLGGGCGGVGLLALLGLGRGGGRVLRESNRGGAENEGKAQHEAHDLLHCVCVSLNGVKVSFLESSGL